MRIKYCSAFCGSGKTHQIINRACELVRAHNRVLILQPTRELIDRTVREELQSRPNLPPFRVFHRGTVGGGKVAKAVADYSRGPPDHPEIVFATHQVFPLVRHFANKGDWVVLVDEEMQVIRYKQHRIPQTHNLITDHLDVTAVNAIYGLATVGAFHLHEMARNEDRDEILETLAETNRILTNPNWDTFVNLEQYARLKNGRGKVLAFHSILQPELLDGFEEVFMAAANFEDSAIFNIWGEQGVQFEPDPVFSRSLRYRHHPNGDLVKILYVTEQQWSRKRREAKLGGTDITVEAALVRAANEVFLGSRFLWHGNKTVIDNPFGQTAQRLPNKPHGLNAFADIDNVVFLSSLNPPTDHFRFLESRGLRGGEVRAFTYYAAAYQAIMRTSIRDPDNRQPKTILVPDWGLAEYLHDIFPGSKIEKLDIGIGEDASKSRGRPRRHHSNRDRLAQQRQKARERRLRKYKATTPAQFAGYSW